MNSEVLLQLVHDLTERALVAEQHGLRLVAERDELKARLAAMEAERDMLREDDVQTNGLCEGMSP